ncbi:MAG: hypothetical protein AAGF94_15755 [Pseudomonadota bacterium]
MYRTVFTALFVIALAMPALGQDKVPVQFQSGADSVTISGTIVGDEYIDYMLGARSGQMMNVGLTVDGTNGDGSVFFNILPPGSDDVAIYNSSAAGNDALIELPENGDYTIRVYQMGNDRDTGKTSGFLIGVGIK